VTTVAHFARRHARSRRLRQLAIICASLLLGVVGTGGTPLAGAQSGGYAPGFDVRGLVDHPAHLTRPDLQRYPPSTVHVTFLAGKASMHATYTGVLLWTLLNAAGVQTNTLRKNDMLSKYVVVTGSDGYQAVIALAEILPDYGHQQILVAYQHDAAPLGADEGMARLVVPQDKRGGRYVDNIVRIEVRTAGR